MKVSFWGLGLGEARGERRECREYYGEQHKLVPLRVHRSGEMIINLLILLIKI
jgi:hypothetical protein